MILLACNAILGLTSFEVIPDGVDAADEQAMTEAGATCEGGQTADVDLKVVCYPCTPLVTEQLLNACTGAQCIPFDRARLTRLLPNGDLPPLPPDPDGG